jgi:hypothetical protein
VVKSPGKGTPSVELDALHPDRLRALVRGAIEVHINNDELTALRLEEKAAREALEEMAVRVESPA